MKIKNMLKGIAVALIAAYFFGIVFGLLYGSRSLMDDLFGSFVFIPIFGLFFSFWFVIPIGAILGILIPKIARNHSRQTTIVYGWLVGVTVGVAGSLALSATGFTTGFRDGYWRDFAIFQITMSLYSALWTTVYAYLCRKKAENNL